MRDHTDGPSGAHGGTGQAHHGQAHDHVHSAMGEEPVKVGCPEHPEITARLGDMGHRGPNEHGGHGGHDKHAGHSVAMFRDKFWISLVLTVPTLVWGHMLP